MPTNKRESLIFTVIMCFCMVLWMSVYNVLRVHGWQLDPSVVAQAWLGLPPAYVVAMLLDVLVASRAAKWFAFRFLVTQELPHRHHAGRQHVHGVPDGAPHVPLWRARVRRAHG